MKNEHVLAHPVHDEVERLRLRLGAFHPRQVEIWRRMGGARRLELVCQAYRFALETVRLTERRRHRGLTDEELNWRIIRRMHADLSMGRKGEVKADG